MLAIAGRRLPAFALAFGFAFGFSDSAGTGSSSIAGSALRFGLALVVLDFAEAGTVSSSAVALARDLLDFAAGETDVSSAFLLDLDAEAGDA